ncbi:hypothetical protein IJT10_04870, partial [bacterium]|nr:hypothetical protein [bacterium]
NMDDAKEVWQEEAREDGLKQGREEMTMEIINRLYESGFSVERISELIKYPVEQVKAMFQRSVTTT